MLILVIFFIFTVAIIAIVSTGFANDILQNRIQSQFLGEASNRGDIIKYLLNTYTDQTRYLVNQISKEREITEFILKEPRNSTVGVEIIMDNNHLKYVKAIGNSTSVSDKLVISSLLQNKIEDYNSLFNNSGKIETLEIFDTNGFIVISSNPNLIDKSIFSQKNVPQNYHKISKNNIVSIGSKIVNDKGNKKYTITTIAFVIPFSIKNQETKNITPKFNRDSENKSKQNIYGEDKKQKFYVLTVIDTNSLNNVLTNRNGLGKTGEIYLVNQSSLMISPSRFINNSSINQPIKVDTLPVRECFYNSGKNANGFYNDYRGIPIAGFSYCAKDMGYVLLSEIDKSEIYQPILDLRDKIIAISSSGGFIFFVISVIFIYVYIKWNKNLKRAVVQSTAKLEEANAYLKKAYEQLKKKDQIQQEFINVAAHELRTPTQAITGYIDILEEIMESSDNNKSICINKIYPYIKTMKRNSNRLLKLVTDILDITKIESGNLKLFKEKISLNEELAKTIQEVKRSNPEVKEKDLEFVINDKIVNTEEEPQRFNEHILVEVDRAKIHQMLYYLLDNAIKFSMANSTITIIIDKRNYDPTKINVDVDIDNENSRKIVIIKIKNNGKGIDTNIQDRLFDKFVTSSEKGLGVGLYISKKIIEAHGGRIWIENKAKINNNVETITDTLNKIEYNITEKITTVSQDKKPNNIYQTTIVSFSLPLY